MISDPEYLKGILSSEKFGLERCLCQPIHDPRMDKLDDLTAVLVEMGYSIYDIERAYIGGHKTVESAIAFISGEVGPVENTESRNRLILRPTQQVLSTEFNLQPVYVNLSDMHWSNQNADDKPDPTKPSIEKPHKNPMQSSSSTTSVNDRFEWEQRESRKIAEAIRKEKAMRQQERERLRAEVAAERQAKQQIPVATGSSAPVATCSTASRDINNPESSKRENMMKIKIVLFERSHAPLYIDLNPSASYADLLDKIQPLLLSIHPERDVPSADLLPASDATLIALDQHLCSLRTTDDCIRLIVQAWPRRELPHPCTHTSQPDTSMTNQQLTDMQIVGGTTIAIRHTNCTFRAQVMEQLAQLNDLRPRYGPEYLHPEEVEETPEEPPPEAEDYPMEREWELNVQDRFPGRGQQLRPQPPDGALPISAFSVQENVRRAAINLAERLHHTTAPTPSATVTESFWTHVPSLVRICFQTVVNSIHQYVDALNAVQSGSIHDNTPRRTATGKRATVDSRSNASQLDQSAVNRQRLEYWLVHQLSIFQWPPVLGQELVRTLIEEQCFSAHTAVFLRNCVSRLDLNHYFLVTTDLIYCLVDRWSNLVELSLNSDDPFQIAPDAICALKRLQNLTSLSLNGLHTVNNETLPYLLELRQLRVLCLCDTKVGDVAWIEALHKEQSEAYCERRPLTKLDLARMGPLMTDAGLCAIVQLFPLLHFLNLSQCHITGSDSDPKVTPLTKLIKLDLSGCTLLRLLPRTLLPLSSTNGSGLRQLLIGGCEQLDLSELLLRLEGQPICRLDGLVTIPSLNGAQLRRFFSSGFPLTDVFLTVCNFTWFYEDPTLLAFILSNLPTNTLTRLGLPLRPLDYSDNRELQTAVCDGLRRLGQCTKLCDLDLGGQIVGPLQFEALLAALANLRALQRITVTNLAQDQENELRQACSPTCKIRIHRHP